MKRDLYKASCYKEAIGVCCMPACDNHLQLENHHIIPLSQCGSDTFDNYIILCQKCHNIGNFHSEWKKHKEKLFSLKIKAEREILGFDSMLLTEDEFYSSLSLFRHEVLPYRTEPLSPHREEKYREECMQDIVKLVDAYDPLKYNAYIRYLDRLTNGQITNILVDITSGTLKIEDMFKNV